MINGSSVTNKAVNDFFSSVQLNVNNPHFLIMQGRITKVLNMKPPEILSMIEEAAGTRMYENKKHDAQKTIEKKDGKLREIDGMVTDQINPKLQRMKDERNQYVEYQRVLRELDQHTRLYVAWQFCQTEDEVKNRKKEMEFTQNEVNSVKATIGELKVEIEKKGKEIGELQVNRDQECGGKLKELENHLKEAEQLEAKSSAKVKSAKETLSADTKHLKQLQKNIDDDVKALNQKNEELSKVQAIFDNLREADKQDAEALAAAQKKFQAVSSGLLESEDGENATLQDQLMVVEQQLNEAEREIKKCTIQMQQDKKEFDTKRPLLKKTEMTFAKDKKELDEKEKEVSYLRENLSKVNYQDGQLESLQEQYRTVSNEYRQCSESFNNYALSCSRLNFQYRDPEPNFDRNKVKGLLCKLFSVKHEQYARALEQAAGGRLYNVVVENEHISAKLIEKGNLMKRTTFVPLNKIQGHRMDQQTIRRAQQEVGAENVFLAQDLVEYSNEYEKVMAWTFGQVFICTTIDAAERISTVVRRKAISLDGDVFDPSGLISGGAVERSQPVLLTVIEFKKAEKNLALKKKELDALSEQLQRLGPIAQNYEQMKERLVIREREVEMLRARLEQTSHYQLQSEIKALQEAIDKNQALIQNYKKDIKEKSVKASELKNKMENIQTVRAKELSNAESELKRMKKKAEDSRNKWKQREQEFETLNLEIQELEKSVQNGKDQLAKFQEAFAAREEELKVLQEELSQLQENVKQRECKVKEQKDEIGQKNAEIQNAVSERDKLTERMNGFDLVVISGSHTIENLKKDISELTAMLNDLQKKHKWIESDREYFGQFNGKYDFKNNDPQAAGAKLQKLREAKEKLGKHASAKSLDILGSQEEQFQEVMDKKTIIEEDRSKILSVIEELDVKKEEVIRRAWDKVNHDFHSILSSLLPSAQAMLKPVDGKDFMQGLEVKVGFGGIWKESLDELSGGQRSLVALSLILAMLLFKPAPLYILDEVDAALDPSHTQNIGQMLKAHFKQSQFIVVSLKDGMFNNANVIFRTSFVDGVSCVTRTTNTGKR
ncbi:structural maintenance of chromosomes protein 2 isoform X2 [Halyomorpha halys]|nr:structural maintenance of chromosomes protein 2 isoform X2 [Halyomorpha halys]